MEDVGRPEPDWDLDYSAGKHAENAVDTAHGAFLQGRGEVKYDRVARRTNRVYIETHCKTARGWQRSGISVTKADFWAFVLDDANHAMLIVSTAKIRNLGLRASTEGLCVEQPRGSHPTVGVAIPIRWFYPEAAG